MSGSEMINRFSFIPYADVMTISNHVKKVMFIFEFLMHSEVPTHQFLYDYTCHLYSVPREYFFFVIRELLGKVRLKEWLK